MSRYPGRGGDYAHHAAQWIDAHYWIAPAAIGAVLIVWVAAPRTIRLSTIRFVRTSNAHRKLVRKLRPTFYPKDSRAAKFIKWPRHPDRAGAKVVIRYPSTFLATPGKLAHVPAALTAHLGGEWVGHDEALSDRLVYVRQAPPAVLPVDVEYLDRTRARTDLIPAGATVDGPVTIDLSSTTPHVLVSATTGWGKTSLLSLIVAHVAGHGGLVDIVDPKIVSFTDSFAGLPNIRIVTELAESIAAIRQFRVDMDAAYTAGRIRTRKGAPRLLVIDEAGTLSADLRRAQGKGQPATFDDVLSILRRGREAGFHVVAACQQANVRALFGSSEVRDQYGYRIAAGPQSAESWGMLFGNEPRPQVAPIVGRAVLAVGHQFEVAQLARITPEVARQVASRGRARHVVSDVVQDVVPRARASEAPNHVETTSETTSATDLQFVPRTEPATRAPAKPPARSGRPPVELTCAHCRRSWSTSAAEGQSVKCAHCGKSRRVPIGARSGDVSAGQ